jgi:hypothetical protein
MFFPNNKLSANLPFDTAHAFSCPQPKTIPTHISDATEISPFTSDLVKHNTKPSSAGSASVSHTRQSSSVLRQIHLNNATLKRDISFLLDSGAAISIIHQSFLCPKTYITPVSTQCHEFHWT